MLRGALGSYRKNLFLDLPLIRIDAKPLEELADVMDVANEVLLAPLTLILGCLGEVDEDRIFIPIEDIELREIPVDQPCFMEFFHA